MQRHHVRRQTLCKPVPHFLGSDVPVARVVATQILTARLPVEALHDGLLHPLYAFHRPFHLPRLHPLAVDLHHPVLTVHIDKVAVRQPSHDVVRMQPPLPIELGSTLRILVVTFTEASLHHQLPLFALRNGLPLLVHKHQFRATFIVRHAHGRTLVALVHLEAQQRTRRLRHAVIVVEHIAVARTLVHQLLAARIYLLQRARTVVEIRQHRRTDKGMRNAMRFDILFQFPHIKPHIPRIEMQLTAALQHSEVRQGCHKIEWRRRPPYHVSMLLPK